MITTRTLFEEILPAFRTPSGDIYNKLAPLIASREDVLELLQNAHYAATAEEERLIARAATLRTAYEQVPALDLVLTPTGFGIVSNQNTAPASRERVQALREELRHAASRAEETMHLHFIQRQAYATPEWIVTTLLWSPSLATSYGLTTADGRPIYAEELQALQPAITAAQVEVARHISPELLHTLITSQYEPETAPDRQTLITALTHQTRQALAAIITHQPPHTTSEHLRALLLSVQTHLEALPEYANSATYRAQTLKPYENKQEDTAFFFA